MAAKKNGRGEMVLESRHLFGLFILLAVLFGVVFTLGYLLGRGQGDSQAHIAAIRADDSADAASADPTELPTAPAPESDTSSAAPGSSAPPAAPGAPAASSGTDWSFYHSGDSKPAHDSLEPAPSAKPTKPAKAAVSPSTPASTPVAHTASTAPAAAGAKPAAKPATPPASRVTVGSPLIPKGAIVLQVAALEKESDALAVAQALQQRKFPAFVLPAGADKYYRVQVGPYASPQAAAAAQKQLESQGFKSILKR